MPIVNDGNRRKRGVKVAVRGTSHADNAGSAFLSIGL